MELNSEGEKATYIRENQKLPLLLAIELINEMPRIVRSNNNLYVFNGKFYDLLADQDIQKAFNDFVLKYGIVAQWKTQVITAIILFFKTYGKIEEVEMNGKTNLLCLKNIVLDTITLQEFEHSSEFFFDTSIDVEYDKNATECPSFINYVNHVFNYDKPTVENIIRLGGYLLDYDVENMKKCNKMFMFDGPGGSGKSTLIETFSLFFAEEQISSLSLDDIGSNNQEKTDIITSRINFTTEQKRSMVEAETIKTVISGERTKVLRKFQDPITIRPKMKIIVACNGLPKFTDTSDGIYRRLMIFTFMNIYKPEPDYLNIKNAEAQGIFMQDRDLLDKIKAEKQSILNLFLGGLKDLRANNFLMVDSPRSEDSLEDFKSMNDTVREFLVANFEVDMEARLPVKLIFDGFRQWYKDNVSEHNNKFRSAELSKRIKDVFTINSNGKEQVLTGGTAHEFSTTYPLKKKDDTYISEPTTNTEASVSSLRDTTEGSEPTQEALPV